MSEPFFIRQAVVPLATRDNWHERTMNEARAQGAMFYRFSEHATIADLCLLEAWHKEPEQQGDVRWQPLDVEDTEPSG